MRNLNLHEYYSEKIRRFIHPLVIKIVSLSSTYKLNITGEIPDAQTFIFVANHWCVDDIPTAAQVIRRHFYALVSDEDRYTADGIALELNGVIWTNRMDKAERQRSKDDLVRHLKLGHSVLMYPEATWNLSPNLPMLPMNYGCISLSLETGVPILPIYLEFKDHVCNVEINPPFYPTENKIDSIEQLRNIMATSAWKFYEQDSCLPSAPITLHDWEENISKRYSKYSRARKDPIGVRQFETKCIFRPKGLVTSEEAFLHINSISPTIRNAFLFSKRVKG